MRAEFRLLCLVVTALVAFAFAGSVRTATKHAVLVVLSHGDDDVSVAPLLARYADEGHRILYATFPGAQDPTAVEGSPARQDLVCASRALGVNETFVTALAGQTLTATAELFAFERRVAERLIELIDEAKPDVMITWGPDGLTGHPLHVMVGNVVTRVFQRQELLKHRPRKLYYIAYPASRFPDLKRLPFGTLSEDLIGVPDAFITTRVDGTRYLKQARAAIDCHTSVRGGFSSNAEWRQAWDQHVTITLGGTVFLRLALPPGDGRETDIFHGL